MVANREFRTRHGLYANVRVMARHYAGFSGYDLSNGMLRPRTKLELYLNGKLVGTILVNRFHGSWYFGEFTPLDAFAEFATLFGRWSLLMHADEDADRLSDAASEELRNVEIAIDRLKAKMRVVDSDQWRHIRQMNIDGELIDWKE